MKSLLQFLRQLQFWLCSGQMHYIHGADTLPPPLSAPEERAMLEALANGNTDAREQLIVHNLRLVVYIAKKFESTGIGLDVACQAKRKKVTRKTQKTALIYPIYGNQSGFSYVI